eukprot:Pgem_evm1s8623
MIKVLNISMNHQHQNSYACDQNYMNNVDVNLYLERNTSRRQVQKKNDILNRDQLNKMEIQQVQDQGALCPTIETQPSQSSKQSPVLSTQPSHTSAQTTHVSTKLSSPSSSQTQTLQSQQSHTPQFFLHDFQSSHQFQSSSPFHASPPIHSSLSPQIPSSSRFNIQLSSPSLQQHDSQNLHSEIQQIQENYEREQLIQSLQQQQKQKQQTPTSPTKTVQNEEQDLHKQNLMQHHFQKQKSDNIIIPRAISRTPSLPRSASFPVALNLGPNDQNNNGRGLAKSISLPMNNTSWDNCHMVDLINSAQLPLSIESELECNAENIKMPIRKSSLRSFSSANNNTGEDSPPLPINNINSTNATNNSSSNTNSPRCQLANRGKQRKEHLKLQLLNRIRSKNSNVFGTQTNPLLQLSSSLSMPTLSSPTTNLLSLSNTDHLAAFRNQQAEKINPNHGIVPKILNYQKPNKEKICMNCKTTVSKVWRIDVKTDNYLCNACGLYEKNHNGRARP